MAKVTAWSETAEAEKLAKANLRLNELSWDAPSRIRAVRT
jgi:hypothetical protein